MRRLSLLAAVALVTGSLIALTSGVAGADTATFRSTTVGTTGSTAPFSMTGSWSMSWSYNCSSYGGTGIFSVSVQQPPGDLADDTGPYQLGMTGSGTDHYFDTGTFHLSVISECTWSITVTSTGAAPSGTPVTFTATEVGTSGSTAQFALSAPWTMSWSYNCSGYGGTGIFRGLVTQSWVPDPA